MSMSNLFLKLARTPGWKCDVSTGGTTGAWSTAAGGGIFPSLIALLIHRCSLRIPFVTRKAVRARTRKTENDVGRSRPRWRRRYCFTECHSVAATLYTLIANTKCLYGRSQQVSSGKLIIDIFQVHLRHTRTHVAMLSHQLRSASPVSTRSPSKSRPGFSILSMMSDAIALTCRCRWL